MADIPMRRHSIASFNRRASHDTRRSSNAPSFDFNRTGESKRRQSIWNPIYIEKEELDEVHIDEDQIRRKIFGPVFNELDIGAIDSSVCRPTTASARRSVMWSRERKLYESQSEKRMSEFDQRPYMHHKYPEIEKHYPGTWRTVNNEEMQRIIRRLSKPTHLSTMRAQSAPVYRKQKHISFGIPVLYTPSPDLYRQTPTRDNKEIIRY